MFKQLLFLVLKRCYLLIHSADILTNNKSSLKDIDKDNSVRERLGKLHLNFKLWNTVSSLKGMPSWQECEAEEPRPPKPWPASRRQIRKFLYKRPRCAHILNSFKAHIKHCYECFVIKTVFASISFWSRAQERKWFHTHGISQQSGKPFFFSRTVPKILCH